MPSLIALVVLAIPPILAGAYAGVEGVDPAARDAAKGMGMTGLRCSCEVELPVRAAPDLLRLRSAALQVVATATIAAIVGLGGLGRFLIDGLARPGLPADGLGARARGRSSPCSSTLAFALVQRYAVSPGLSRAGPRRGDIRLGIAIHAPRVDGTQSPADQR